MDRTQLIKEAHPWLSYDNAVKVLLYHQGSICIQNLERNKLERSMGAFKKLVKSKRRNNAIHLNPLQSRFQACISTVQMSWQSDRRIKQKRVFRAQMEQSKNYPFEEQINLLTNTLFSCYKYQYTCTIQLWRTCRNGIIQRTKYQ